MATKDFKRKPSAILSADVAGYSRLMGEDEAATVEAITTYNLPSKKGLLITSPTRDNPSHTERNGDKTNEIVRR